ncbi:MAG: hypothetical protein KKH88_04370 [Nanoarchaeota archaeon]|nr:hypothetical protein [Nanoarchaeota archaeon]
MVKNLVKLIKEESDGSDFMALNVFYLNELAIDPHIVTNGAQVLRSLPFSGDWEEYFEAYKPRGANAFLQIGGPVHQKFGKDMVSVFALYYHIDEEQARRALEAQNSS